MKKIINDILSPLNLRLCRKSSFDEAIWSLARLREHACLDFGGDNHAIDLKKNILFLNLSCNRTCLC